ncbi:Amino acid/polyamine transporter I [Lasiodiplodia theobromae]|nr:Amino acid/polyamine transporter I [Lasiodiplodia theobromae]
MAEKDLYAVGVGESESHTHEARDIKDVVDAKGVAVGEAADIYGDVQTAEEYGYVHRGLKSRHIQFIALGGTIGTGLFLGIGKAFATSGPLSVLLGYSFTGLAGNWSIDDFITAYIGIPIYFGLYLFWKVFKREPFVKAAEADLWSGKAALDAQIWPERLPRNVWEKIWFWIA